MTILYRFCISEASYEQVWHPTLKEAQRHHKELLEENGDPGKIIKVRVPTNRKGLAHFLNIHASEV